MINGMNDSITYRRGSSRGKTRRLAAFALLALLLAAPLFA
jgi:hypothetical protein